MSCGCRERKEILTKQVGRRGLIKGLGMVVAAFGMGARTLKAQVAVAHDREAIKVLRIITTALHWHKDDTGSFADLSEVTKSAAWERIKKEISGPSSWLPLMAMLERGERLAGWNLKHSLTSTGYAMSINTTDSTTFHFSTDEEGVFLISQPQQVKGWVSGLFFRCIGANNDPGCCCQYPCCDLVGSCCGSSAGGKCFSCGCQCCKWCPQPPV
jgi:hypothetical protein